MVTVNPTGCVFVFSSPQYIPAAADVPTVHAAEQRQHVQRQRHEPQQHLHELQHGAQQHESDDGTDEHHIHGGGILTWPALHGTGTGNSG